MPPESVLTMTTYIGLWRHLLANIANDTLQVHMDQERPPPLPRVHSYETLDSKLYINTSRKKDAFANTKICGVTNIVHLIPHQIAEALSPPKCVEGTTAISSHTS